MLHSVKDIAGFELAARDGTIGHVKEVYFDDRQWVIRHLVVDTGGWLSGRRVLVSPHAIEAIDRPARQLRVALTRQQVEDAPPAESDRPVSRQYEIAAYDFYGYPYYWGGSSLWGMMDLPMGGAVAPYTAGTPPPVTPAAEGGTAPAAAEAAQRDAGDPHLRSSSEVEGYDIQARDGAIGHVDDFLFDDASWQIALVVVDTHNWLPDRLVLVPPSAVDSVDWSARQAVVRATRDAIKASPPYARDQVLDRAAAQQVRERFAALA